MLWVYGQYRYSDSDGSRAEKVKGQEDTLLLAVRPARVYTREIHTARGMGLNMKVLLFCNSFLCIVPREISGQIT